MTRIEFINKVSLKLKLIRLERDYTQDKMADIIGISKKTLVQIEKGRSLLGWSGAVALCTIFRDSEVLEMTFGGDPQDIILSLAFTDYESNEKTMGGKIWWTDIEGEDQFRIQQNIISRHYRILDGQDRRICSSFDDAYIRKRFRELLKKAEV
ncbi:MULTISPECIES: helix-turn-helix transcriptional regulator [Desulfosporosinus]|uniref:Helix-turn-helix domain-containing protein n=1 Tax=Desulfosporosinus nitroreducens TaxID=2018668 RepID=A0ABT8QWB1_9FIRM|nr:MULTISPECIES: helix-turn-helix domain-containing protein [Desulfosporosinus]MCO1602491.1 helix-turn-helix domain-containing protein [Desulfosporosinus nitroreducens]MDA8223011.1 helix-turn-helix domain-containing protein [Desulfitobacterium hafniense]MDO0824176.1 helix-turn-helix domain-containing protein [Desulfosporosinus nitroreducens]